MKKKRLVIVDVGHVSVRVEDGGDLNGGFDRGK
jgi:hypothetical protein